MPNACYLSYKSCSLPAAAMKHHNHILGNWKTQPSKIKFNLHHNYVVLFINAKGNSNDSQEAPVPSKPPSAWKKWAAGLVLTLVLPSYRHKMGPFMVLKNKVDVVIETVETVAEVVEDLAETVEKLSDVVEEKLPEDSKLKETAELVENLAKQVDEKAEVVQHIIEQVQNVEEQIEEMMDSGRGDAKIVSHETRLDEQDQQVKNLS